jgi:galactofuranosylgalactofuranosylrhamnosyl-N-acetylglucosaminyl-diphospho-decaprenol beta-1,5/1,6-galactofuranosyltransferase
MSKTNIDDASHAATRQSGKAASLLARVILPRPGEPLDVRKLYL